MSGLPVCSRMQMAVRQMEELCKQAVKLGKYFMEGIPEQVRLSIGEHRRPSCKLMEERLYGDVLEDRPSEDDFLDEFLEGIELPCRKPRNRKPKNRRPKRRGELRV